MVSKSKTSNMSSLIGYSVSTPSKGSVLIDTAKNVSKGTAAKNISDAYIAIGNGKASTGKSIIGNGNMINLATPDTSLPTFKKGESIEFAQIDTSLPTFKKGEKIEFAQIDTALPKYEKNGVAIKDVMKNANGNIAYASVSKDNKAKFADYVQQLDKNGNALYADKLSSVQIKDFAKNVIGENTGYYTNAGANVTKIANKLAVPATLEMSFDNVSDIIRYIDQSKNQIQEIWSGAILNLVNQIEGSWFGADSQAYIEKVKALEPKVNNMIKALDLLSRTYTKALEKTRATNQQSKNAVNSL